MSETATAWERGVVQSHLAKDQDGGCCLPLAGKTEFVNIGLPNISVDLHVHGSFGCHIADVGHTYYIVHGFESHSHADCGHGVEKGHAICENILCKYLFSRNLRKFSPAKETCYTVCPLQGNADTKGEATKCCYDIERALEVALYPGCMGGEKQPGIDCLCMLDHSQKNL